MSTHPKQCPVCGDPRFIDTVAHLDTVDRYQCGACGLRWYVTRPLATRLEATQKAGNS